jgi:hypothetical protein
MLWSTGDCDDMMLLVWCELEGKMRKKRGSQATRRILLHLRFALVVHDDGGKFANSDIDSCNDILL